MDDDPEKLPAKPNKNLPYARNKQDLLRLSDMLSLGATRATMAERLGLTVRTLDKLYGRELDKLGMQSGRKPHIPSDLTRNKVKLMAGIGLKRYQIAKVMSVSVSVLEESYADELDTAESELHLRVGANLVRMATGNGPDAAQTAKFYMDRRVPGWQNRSEVAMTGPDGQPLRSEAKVIIMLPENGRESKPPTIEHDPD